MVPNVSQRCLTLILSLLIFALLISAPRSVRADIIWYGSDGEELPFTTNEQVLDFLSSADIVWKEKLTQGTNKKKRKVLLDRGGVKAHAIHRTGYEVKYIARGGFVDSYESEIAAYNLNRLLGMNSVPPVVRRKGGSLQLWIEKVTTEASRVKADEEPPDPIVFDQSIKNLRVFDNLIANTDRNPGNILIADSGKVWYIDHTRSFAGQTELRSPDSITGCDRDLWHHLQTVPDAEIRSSLKGLIGSYTDELLKRRRLVVELIKERISAESEENFLFDAKAD